MEMEMEMVPNHKESMFILGGGLWFMVIGCSGVKGNDVNLAKTVSF